MKRLLINVTTVLVILIVIEIVSRFALDKIYNRDFDSSLIIDNKYFDSPGLKPNAHGKVWGKDFNTDEYGGRKMSANSNAKAKILYIGDSVTEGVGVDDSATFLALSKPVEDEAVNLSLIGYSTHDYFNIANYCLLKDSAVRMVEVYYCLNDVYGASKTKDLPVMAKHNIVGVLNSFLQNHYATYKLLKLWVYKNSSSYFKYDLQFYKTDDPFFKNAMADLKSCDSVCRAHGTGFTVTLLPYRSQLTGKYKGNYTPQTMVKAYCKANGIAYRDATGELSRINEKPGCLYLFADEIHFSQTGHKAIAGILK